MLRVADMPAFVFELEVPEDFNYRACLGYLQRSPLECMYRVEGERVIRALRGEAGPLVIEISQPGGPASPSLHIAVHAAEGSSSARSSERTRQEVDRYLREWFDLDRDLSPFYRLAAESPLLTTVVDANRGLRLIGVPDLFEALCWAIAGQQIHLAFAYTLKRGLVEAYGERVSFRDGELRLFPLPERIAATSLDDLCALRLTRAKAAAIREAAERMTAGTLSRELLLACDGFETAEQDLRSVRGIGPWTAQYVRMRCLRDPSAFPAGDAGLQNAVRGLLGMARKPTEAELRAMAADWSGWESYAAFYLWRALSA